MARKRRKRRSKKGLFRKPRSKVWSAIISIENPATAKASVKALSKGWRSLTRAQKRKRIQYAVCAMNRAKVLARKRGISLKEKKELRAVARIYANWIKKHRLTR